MNNKFRGVGTALVTPFQGSGAIDEAALRRLIQMQLQGGIDFLVPCGTTGETPTLDDSEYTRVIHIAVEEASGQVPVLAGAGSNSTAKAVHLTEMAADAGASGTLHVAPYYNKPTQEGLYQHFKSVARATSLPVVVYNIPGRCGVNVDVTTLLRLGEVENIVAVKEASANLPQIMELAAADRSFDLLSGDDSWTLALLALGGAGVISVVANQIPAVMKSIVDAALRGDFAAARQIHSRYLRLMNLNFIETNPVPVKAGLAMMGIIEEQYRLPLVPMRPESRSRLQAELQRLGLVGVEQPARR